MGKNAIVRGALAISIPFNLAAAFVFAFPDSALGRLQGLPSDAPALYRALLALFLVLFAGAYSWLSAQKQISRPLLALGAIGKAFAFLTFMSLALANLCSTRLAMGSIGDVVLASVFGWWLLTSRSTAAQ